MMVMNVSSVWAATVVYNASTYAVTDTNSSAVLFDENGDNEIKSGKSHMIKEPAGTVTLETGVTAEDGVSFGKAVFPSGGTNSTTNGYSIKLNAGQKLGVYYTIADSAFTNASKFTDTKKYTAHIQACASTDTNTDLINDADTTKYIKTVYYDSFTAEQTDIYYVYSSASRLIAYSFVISGEGTNPENPTNDTYTW